MTDCQRGNFFCGVVIFALRRYNDKEYIILIKE
jgi:hypothetical protein